MYRVWREELAPELRRAVQINILETQRAESPAANVIWTIIFAGKSIPVSDAARGGSRPPLSAYFKPQPEYRRSGQQWGWPGTFRARQGAGHAAAAVWRCRLRSGRIEFCVAGTGHHCQPAHVLFPDMEIVKADVFHVTRDAELAIQVLEIGRFARERAGSRLAPAISRCGAIADR